MHHFLHQKRNRPTQISQLYYFLNSTATPRLRDSSMGQSCNSNAAEIENTVQPLRYTITPNLWDKSWRIYLYT